RAFAKADSRNCCLCAVLVCRYHCKSVGWLPFPQVSAGQKSQPRPGTDCPRNRHYLGATHLVDDCRSHLSHHRPDQGTRNRNGCDRVCVRDILQNFLAGILLLLHEPFRIEDEIKVDDLEGTVEAIEARATVIRTFDARRIVIPNTDLFTKAVTVNTAYQQRRSEYIVGIGYG